METKRIAWDGVAFAVPRNWELGLYRFPGRGLCHLEIEDEYAVRLDVEWVRPRRPAQTQHILARFERATSRLARQAVRRQDLAGLPAGWTAARHTFREILASPRRGRDPAIVAHELVTALFCCAATPLVACLRLHVMPGDTEDPEATLRLIAAQFAPVPDGAWVPWELFDIAFRVPRAFALAGTRIEIGAKLMVFTWRGRRLHLWHLSCANVFLTDGVRLEDWVAGYLNGCGDVPGIAFHPGAAGELACRPARRLGLTHRDHLARWCFRHAARCRLDAARNQVVAWVFSYRKPEDLEVLPPELSQP